ncbi:MAG: class I SAM-dependent methyltransferase [Candidatus Marinimicrobia bacterium]|nr:class I SAM-dependent methyltransferase [Candidatus Neomarinimicrobiota bacterium]
MAEFKAELLNAFVKDKSVKSVIEFGCGDGHQLSLASYPKYIGLDVSKTAIELCTERFRDDNKKRFALYNPDNFVDSQGIFKAELALSLDVIYHLIEDRIFELHMRHLFSAAEKYVVIYSSNIDSDQVGHQRHRKFSNWIDAHVPVWDLLKETPNRFPYKGDESSGSLANFFIYVKS